MSTNTISIFFSLVSMCLLFVSCSVQQLTGGTDTETGGTVVTGSILQPDGRPAANTIVDIIPDNYNPLHETQSPGILTDTTDTNGFYTMRVLNKGTYNIQAEHAITHDRLLLYGVACNDSSTQVHSAILSKPGAIRLFLSGSKTGYCYIPGTRYFTELVGNAPVVIIDSLPAGIVPAIVYSSIDSVDTPKVRYNVEVVSGDTTDEFNLSWKHSVTCVMNTSPTGANVNGTITNFPVLIRLTASNFDFSQAKSNGEDIRFAKSDNTFLPCEIELWNVASQTAALWVKVDTVYGNNDSQYVTMYWGNSGVTSYSDSAAVFDTTSGFAGVWHMNQDVNSKIPDATANGIDGIASSTTTITGAIGMAQEFDGMSGMIQASGPASDKLNFPENSTFSVSAWVKSYALDSMLHAIIFKSNFQYGLQILPDNQWEFFNYIEKTRWEATRSPAEAAAWHLVTGVISGSQQYLYIDGVCTDSAVVTTPAVSPDNVARTYNKPFEIGHCSDGGLNNNRYFYGIIDEVRISNKAVSADWIKLCYMNQRASDMLVIFK